MSERHDMPEDQDYVPPDAIRIGGHTLRLTGSMVGGGVDTYTYGLRLSAGEIAALGRPPTDKAPDAVVAEAMRVFRSLPHPTSMQSDAEMRAALDAVWPFVTAAFRPVADAARAYARAVDARDADVATPRSERRERFDDDVDSARDVLDLTLVGLDGSSPLATGSPMAGTWAEYRDLRDAFGSAEDYLGREIQAAKDPEAMAAVDDTRVKVAREALDRFVRTRLLALASPATGLREALRIVEGGDWPKVPNFGVTAKEMSAEEAYDVGAGDAAAKIRIQVEEALKRAPSGTAEAVPVHDPVHGDGDGWWFWDETWADRHGPYADERTARAHLSFYGHVLTYGPLGVRVTPAGAGSGADLGPGLTEAIKVVTGLQPVSDRHMVETGNGSEMRDGTNPITKEGVLAALAARLDEVGTAANADGSVPGRST